MSRLRAKVGYRAFGLGPGIRRNLKTTDLKSVRLRFEEQYCELDSRRDKEKGIMAFHRMFLITGLALYRAIADELENQDECIDAIHDIMWNGRMSRMVSLAAFFVRRSKDPFHRFLQVLGPKNEWFFPCPPWEKAEVEIENGIGWHQRRCPMVDFFDEEGEVDLCRAYGDMDERIAELLPEHVELRREHAMCRGGEWCDFLYHRK